MSLIRLLQRKPDGEIVFREPTSGEVPAYAILSHTWGEEEVIYEELKKGKDKCKTVNKAGWRKIQFCAKQAAVDGLEYFWVDTCCIDKKNAVELGAAINSMFRWYQNAARCYVYLSDVSKPDTGVDDRRSWGEAFRKSRWFTRGWTLQELIAPRLVDFFSSEGSRLGSKLSLESKIYEITGIANKALRGDALSNFSIKERRSWAEHRNTTIEEDKAYCLIGIFDVSMVPNYGERSDQAFRRLEDEIHRLHKGVDSHIAISSSPNPKRRLPITVPDSTAKRLRGAIVSQHANRLSPDSPIISSQERDGNTGYCNNCREIRLDDDLAQTVEGMPKIYGRRICSLKYTQSVSLCDLCDVFREITRKHEKHTPVLSAASPKHWLGVPLPRVQESGVLLFVGYDSKGWYADDSQVLVMVDDTSAGISGREHSIERIDFGIIKGLLSYCRANHKLCATISTFPIVDLQVIDCQSGQITSLPGNTAYIAVSYVWGSTEHDSTNSKGSLWSRAPKTITDTMALALQLDVSYIWVDRYCIPQDDEHRKRILISKIGLIYSYATLTVIAAAGESPHYGLPGVGTTKRKHPTTMQIGSKMFAICRDVRRELAESKWNSRGWTYQEALLSRRRLVFTDSQFYFQCCAMHCPESLSLPLQLLHISTGQRFPEKLSIWTPFPNRSVGNDLTSPMDRIAEYIHRDLKLDADILNAFQGIIEEFKISKRPVRFVSGVPLAPLEYVTGPGLDKKEDTSQLVFGLTWGDIKHFYLFARGRFSRRVGFPSWSWLGWKVEKTEAEDKHERSPKMELFGLMSRYYPIGNRRLPNFQNYVDIGVELPDSTVVPWEGNRALIEGKFDDGKFPKYLHVKGWTFNLEIKRDTIRDDWEVSWPEPSVRHKDYQPLNKCCDINLSYIMADQLSTTLSVLILCNAPRKQAYKVCLLIKYSKDIMAYERIGICNLDDLLWYSGGRMMLSEATIEERSPTHATLGHLQLVKSEIRLG